MDTAVIEPHLTPDGSRSAGLGANQVERRGKDVTAEHTRAHFAELLDATGDRLATLLFFVVMGGIALFGWHADLDRFITPEYGVGYLLGIAGGSLMLLLLIYPVRKRLPRARWLGSPRGWFRAHMLLGVVGPICILYHCNYSLGAMNSNVALLCMLIVSGSGMFGRYFYSRIHYGLYGTTATRAELREDMSLTRERLADLFTYEPRLKRRLAKFERLATSQRDGEFMSTTHALSMGLRTHWIYAASVPLVKHATYAQATAEGWGAVRRRRQFRHTLRLLQVHLDVTRKLAQIGIFERLFSLWHVFHVPLFAMMLLSAIGHVVAVHVF